MLNLIEEQKLIEIKKEENHGLKAQLLFLVSECSFLLNNINTYLLVSELKYPSLTKNNEINDIYNSIGCLLYDIEKFISGNEELKIKIDDIISERVNYYFTLIDGGK
jgi:hypothetical protein